MPMHTDPFYCYEHKCYMLVCEWEKHSYETDEAYEERVKARENHHVHDCPSCRCQPFLAYRVLY